MSHRDVEMNLGLAGPVTLGWPANSTRGFGGIHLEISAAGQLVEMMARHVGVKIKAFGALARGDRFVGMNEEENLATGGVAERRSNRRDRGSELGGAQVLGRSAGGAIHAGIVPTAIGEIQFSLSLPDLYVVLELI